MRSASRVLFGSVLAVLLTCVTPAASAAPNYQGLWWNAPAGSESGWGINLAHQGDVLFATWFTYDAAGDGWWLSMTANRTAEGTYSGTLIESGGPGYSAVPFDPSKVTRTPVGNATLTFSDADNGTFSYTAKGVQQSKTITRFAFGVVPTCTGASAAQIVTATNYQDLWWAAGGGESGWGINFTHQGDVIFATWFTYDADGTPLWFSATAGKVATGVYTGSLIRTTGPAFSAVPFDPARVTRAEAGTLTLTFSDGNSAAFAYTLGGVTRTKAITRMPVSYTGTRCAAPLAATIKGKVFDGAIEKAVVCADANGNGRCEAGEVQALTDAAGAYELAAPEGYRGPLAAEVVAGQSRDAGPPATAVDRTYRMASPSRDYSTNITPFSTIVRLTREADYRLAEEFALNELGLPPRFAINLQAAPASGSLANSVAAAIVAALKDAHATSVDYSSSDALASVVARFPAALTHLPKLDIDTHGEPINQRETYIDGHLTITNPAASGAPTQLAIKIRGRGNSTWWEAKKPYKVQIVNDAAYAGVADFLGMKKNRNWVLLADHLDHSLMRNKLAYSLGNSSVFSDGLKWNPSGQHVEVTLNGEYVGVYLFAEDIRVDSTRLNIRKISASQLDGGYIVEVDYPLDCDPILQFTTPRGVRICVDTPDEEAITPAQNQYIRDYLRAVEGDIYGSGNLSRINAVSFADWYLLQELFRNPDAAFYSSDRMWKDADTAAIPGDRLLNIGPIWDFDISAGNSDQYQTNGCWVNKGFDITPDWPNWYRKIFDHPEFLDLAIARWQAKRPALERFVNAAIDSFARRLSEAQARNFDKWQVLGTTSWNTHYVFSTWQEEVDFLRHFLNERMAWMDQAFASPEAYNSLCR